MTEYRTHHEMLIEDLRTDPEYTLIYLQVALEEFEEDGDFEHFMSALRNVSEAQGGVSPFGALGEVVPSSSEKSEGKDGYMFGAVHSALRGLGYKMTVTPLAEP